MTLKLVIMEYNWQEYKSVYKITQRKRGHKKVLDIQISLQYFAKFAIQRGMHLQRVGSEQLLWLAQIQNWAKFNLGGSQIDSIFNL